MLRTSRIRRSIFSAAIGVCAAMTCPDAWAGIVVDNLGVGTSSELEVHGQFNVNFPETWVATQFTVGAGEWQFNSITAKFRESTSLNPDQLQLQVRDESGGNPGGSVLGTLNVSSDISSTGDYLFNPSSGFTLAGGINYWLVAVPTSATADYWWKTTTSFDDNGASGWSIGNLSKTSTNTGGSWDVVAGQPTQFSIDATAVPEPGSIVLAALASAGGALVSKRRRRTHVSLGLPS